MPLVLDNMVRYWYCANIPPRPLDDKELEKGRVGEKYGYLIDEKIWEPMRRKRTEKDPS